MMLSESKKYRVIVETDDSEKVTYETYSSTSKSVHEKNKYEIVKVIRVEDDHIIHQYKKANTTSPFKQFVTIRGQEWWFDGRHYMLKLFVNCDTGEVYDDPLHREESEYYQSGMEFIWTGPCKISPSGNYMLMEGCVWSFPYETKLYDISDLSKGYREIDIFDHLVDQEKDDIDTDEDAVMKFVSDNEIEITHVVKLENGQYKKLENGEYELVYYNTVKY